MMLLGGRAIASSAVIAEEESACAMLRSHAPHAAQRSGDTQQRFAPDRVRDTGGPRDISRKGAATK
ncbi:hypothetical protein UNPF46_33700 [Bradyrhizobium sp. UNPF46]|nr:hypothetical protein UNPF46_33700 [Bradyrhizobium sp. UNPF46]